MAVAPNKSLRVFALPPHNKLVAASVNKKALRRLGLRGVLRWEPWLLLFGGLHFNFQRLGLHFAEPGVVAFLLVFVRKAQAVLARQDVAREPVPAGAAIQPEAYLADARMKEVGWQRYGFTLAGRDLERLGEIPLRDRARYQLRAVGSFQADTQGVAQVEREILVAAVTDAQADVRPADPVNLRRLSPDRLGRDFEIHAARV